MFKLITKKYQEPQAPWGFGWAINFGIRHTEDDWIEKMKKIWGFKKYPEDGSLEALLYKEKACLVASYEEILKWDKKHFPKSHRLKGHRTPVPADKDVMILGLGWNEFHEYWELIPIRHAGRRY